MKFDLGVEVGALEYDFTTIPNCPPELSDAKGIIPEPSTELVDYFIEKRNTISQFVEEWAAEQGSPDEEKRPSGAEPKRTTRTKRKGAAESFEQRLAQWMSEPGKANSPERVAVRDAMIDMLAKVCQGSPTREQIAALGHRHRVAFMEWLTAELVDPKGFLRNAMTN